MATQRNLFLSDGKDQRPVHIQRFTRRSPDDCQPHKDATFPAEMFMPAIPSGIIQGHFVATLRIEHCLMFRFAE
ncbi:MAG: hypothetical protein ACREOH_22560 [Candidatus Entotheonellia bacterium]